MGNFIWTAIVLCIGVLLGIFLMGLGTLMCHIGYLRVDTSDPDGPYLFLEATKPVSEIRKFKYVLLEVKDRNYIEEAVTRK